MSTTQHRQTEGAAQARMDLNQDYLRGVNENGIEIGEYTFFYGDKGAVSRTQADVLRCVGVSRGL
jgi:hypothetical protein